MQTHPLVTTTEALAEVVQRARTSRRIALDTEFFRERTYRARLCLVQIATLDDLWLIDPVGELRLHELAELVADPQVEVVVHAGKQDFELLFDQFGVVPAAVFDVQVGAGFAGLGASLPYGRLIEATLGVKLQKGESYTDWCHRPLTDAQLDYAADDVRYLLPAVDTLKSRLTELSRLEWVLEEMSSLESPDSYGADPAEAWRRVGGRGTLSGRQAAVLREVAKWREETAARRDVPRGWVIKDPTLVEIARRSPTSVAALKGIRGINTKEAERSGREILAAAQRGKEGEPIQTAPSPSRVAIARARMMSGLADAVVRARCEQAGIATELVSTRGELEALLADVVAGSVEEGDNHHRLLTGWRRDLAGGAVLMLAEGRLAVKAIDAPPYIEEVPL